MRSNSAKGAPRPTGMCDLAPGEHSRPAAASRAEAPLITRASRFGRFPRYSHRSKACVRAIATSLAPSRGPFRWELPVSKDDADLSRSEGHPLAGLDGERGAAADLR